MNPDSATTPSTPAPSAPGPQSAPAAPLNPVQIFWEVATLAMDLLARLVHVIQPVQSYYLAQSRLMARLLIDITRLLLTIRYAPERITITQLRRLTRARHILLALFNYTLPTLGPRTSPSANATTNQSPSASTENATPLGPRTSSSASATPSSSTIHAAREVPAVRKVPAVATVREIPEVPLVAGLSSRKTPAAASAQTPVASPGNPLAAIDHPQPAVSDSHPSHSAFSPYIPDFHTLAQALKGATLPPNCAGALFENPGDALVKALHQLHAIYFYLYPTQSPSPSPSPSQSQSEILNLKSEIPTSPSPSQSSANSQSSSVHPVHPVHDVHSPAQSVVPHSAFRIPHSTAPP